MTKTSNMYEWIDMKHTHIGGKCPHECIYCYVQKMPWKLKKYEGELRLIAQEFKKNYGSGNTIFIEHCNDLFAEAVPDEWRLRILEHCNRYKNNTYVFQTKNPENYLHLLGKMPPKVMLGVTLETNRHYDYPAISKAPSPAERHYSMRQIIGKSIFVTIEPILDFDVDIFAQWIMDLSPDFVNIGADSKGCNLPEPPWSKVKELIRILRDARIKVREKTNLKRLEV